MKKMLRVLCVSLLTLAVLVPVSGCKVNRERDKSTAGESTGFGTTTPSSTDMNKNRPNSGSTTPSNSSGTGLK